MRRKLLVLAAMASAVLSPLALAGLTQPQPVVVNLVGDGSGSAFGNMVTARFTANKVEFIGCGLRVFDGGDGAPPTLFIFCQASDAAGNLAFCSTESTAHLDALKGIADGSFITFSFNAEGVCQQIGNSTQSFYIR
jgi:hypothetical protein